MPDIPLRVLLDAQAIVAEGFGRSGVFRHLLRDAADRRVILIVPELAVAETVAIYRRRLHKHRAALHELPALLRAADVPAELGTERLAELMERRLRSDLEAAGVTPSPSPNIDGDDLVRRVLARRKPTKPPKLDGKGNEQPDQPEGFRDQLLWAHVREAARTDPVVFVTNNTHDFAEGGGIADGRAALHSQLREDLEHDRQTHGSTGDVDLFTDLGTVVREFLQDEDVFDAVRELLDGDAGNQLRRAAAALVDVTSVPMDEFMPESLVEGDIEEATLSAFLPDDTHIELEDAYLESAEDEARPYRINATVVGQGDVDWYVSVPTAGDILAFGEHVENADEGGGLLQRRDEVVPVLLSVYGQYTPSTGEWSALRIDYASMPGDEVERLAKAHRAEEFRRLQALGLQPSDEEIDAMVEEHERARGAAGAKPPSGRRRIARRIRRKRSDQD